MNCVRGNGRKGVGERGGGRSEEDGRDVWMSGLLESLSTLGTLSLSILRLFLLIGDGAMQFRKVFVFFSIKIS